jgi:hypothetical protein
MHGSANKSGWPRGHCERGLLFVLDAHALQQFDLEKHLGFPKNYLRVAADFCRGGFEVGLWEVHPGRSARYNLTDPPSQLFCQDRPHASSSLEHCDQIVDGILSFLYSEILETVSSAMGSCRARLGALASA